MNTDLERTIVNLSIAITEKQASEEDISELNELLRQSSDARQIYLKVMDLHFDLDRMSLTGALSSQIDTCSPAIRKIEKISDRPRQRSFAPLLALAALVAVSLSLFFVSGIFQSNSFEAVIIESESDDWSIGTIFKQNDTIKLNENQKLKLKFGDNTLVELSGPIQTKLDQSDEQGKRFSINEKTNKSKRFTVDTGNTSVTVTADKTNSESKFIITEPANSFGIQFRKELTEVHVFRGEVTSKANSAKNQSLETQKIHTLQAAVFNRDGLLKKWTAPDFKTFGIERKINGVVSTNRNVHWLNGKPVSLIEGQLESNSSIFLIQEKQNVVLPHEIPVTFYERLQRGSGGTQSAYATHIRMLPGGKKVDSYLLHFDPAAKKFLDGEITFDRPIVALIARGNQLDYSDKFFALEGTTYPSPKTPWRGLDGNRKDEGVDVLKFMRDPNKIGIRFNIETDTIDQLRILVESE